MYCPQCLTEYRDGFYECADCHVPLAAGLPPEPVDELDDTNTGGRDVPAAALAVSPAALTGLITVLETSDSFALGLAQSSLREAGIEFVTRCEEHGYHPEFTSTFSWAPPICPCWCRVQVAPEDESEARALLEPLQNPETVSEVEEEPEADAHQ